MAKKQTRRSISFARADYEAAQEAAKRLEIPLAQLAAEALHEHLKRNWAKENAAAVAKVMQVPARAGDILGIPPPPPAPAPTQIDELIDRSSVGAGLRNIRENGIDAELVALDADLRAAESSGADVKVMYDEDVQAKRAAAAARRKR